jgi:Flp/Fap pilin component
MSKVGNLLRNFLDNEQGATAIEYGLLAAGIAVAIALTPRRGSRAPPRVNGRSTSFRHDRDSVGVGRMMGRHPASGRPRSLSLWTGAARFLRSAERAAVAPLNAQFHFYRDG